jgi:3-oxoacyl-[acyl-carrier protein] reductase
MDLNIAGKSALVTGASRGIGFAVAEALAAAGVRLVINARGEEGLQEAAAKLRAGGAEVHAVVGDLASAKGVAAVVEGTLEAVGAPQILIANAGGPPTGSATSIEDRAWAQGFELTLMSSVRLARAAVPAMIASGWGRVVFITSLSVKQPIPELTLSNSFRAGLTAFARTLASEVGEYGVTVNAVAPGYTATARLAALISDDYTRANLIGRIPLKRFGEPSEIAAATAFLCSTPAAYITGQTLLVDGGLVNATY